MCQDCVRSLPEIHSTLCITKDSVCAFVCVCLTLLALLNTNCFLPMVLAHLSNQWGGPRLHGSRLRPVLARGSIHPVYHVGHSVCVCVCLILPASPNPTTYSRCSETIDLICGLATLSCVKIPSDPCARLHPLCVSRVSLSVCVCVCHCMLTPPPQHPPDVHRPMI